MWRELALVVMLLNHCTRSILPKVHELQVLSDIICIVALWCHKQWCLIEMTFWTPTNRFTRRQLCWVRWNLFGSPILHGARGCTAYHVSKCIKSQRTRQEFHMHAHFWTSRKLLMLLPTEEFWKLKLKQLDLHPLIATWPFSQPY